ncbi:MAG: YceH family protein [Proteobacteria bacterium]|nr:YceH family protein [Pseudomonadota bacterium]
MDILFSHEEIRVLGALIEKEFTTPEYYPLTLNALTSACNQKTNREPVVNYAEEIVLEAIEGLKKKRALWQSNLSRAIKYEEGFVKERDYDKREAAVICTLMLRGPQTVGEIKAHTERIYSFENLEEVNSTLEGLSSLGDITRLPRQPGRKEARYCHLFLEEGESSTVLSSDETATDSAREESEKISELEEKIEALTRQLEDLKEQFSQFQKQFE